MTDPASFQVRFTLPFRKNEFFVGRENCFKQLDSILSKAGSKYTAVLYGIGGIGKTEVAVHYVYRKIALNCTVLWLDASSLESLRDSFLKVAQQLVDHYIRLVSATQPPYGMVAEALGLRGMLDDEGRMKNNVHEPDSIVYAVITWLGFKTNQGWLADYDNYDDPENFAIADFMPSDHAGRIIVTSRRRDCARLGQGLEIGNLSVQESVELLYRNCQMFSDIPAEEGTRTLCVP